VIDPSVVVVVVIVVMVVMVVWMSLSWGERRRWM